MTLRNAAGALLALLAFGVVSPSIASAGCLHPHGVTSGRTLAHLDRLALAGALSVPRDEADSAAPVPRCAGLRCSNDPAPAHPAAPVISPVAERWGNLDDLAFGPENTPSPLPGDEPSIRPRHRGASLFHPPR